MARKEHLAALIETHRALDATAEVAARQAVKERDHRAAMIERPPPGPPLLPVAGTSTGDTTPG